MLIRIDPVKDRPIYAQIADSVRASVSNGRLKPGERLPAAGEIADGLGVNKHTVLHAYQLLRDEGIVDLRRGRGAVVTPLAEGIAELHLEAQQLAERARSLGVEADTLAAIVAHASAANADDMHAGLAHTSAASLDATRTSIAHAGVAQANTAEEDAG